MIIGDAIGTVLAWAFLAFIVFGLVKAIWKSRNSDSMHEIPKRDRDAMKGDE